MKRRKAEPMIRELRALRKGEKMAETHSFFQNSPTANSLGLFVFLRVSSMNFPMNFSSMCLIASKRNPAPPVVCKTQLPHASKSFRTSGCRWSICAEYVRQNCTRYVGSHGLRRCPRDSHSFRSQNLPTLTSLCVCGWLYGIYPWYASYGPSPALLER